jgi:hypothetical protein
MSGATARHPGAKATILRFFSFLNVRPGFYYGPCGGELAQLKGFVGLILAKASAVMISIPPRPLPVITCTVTGIFFLKKAAVAAPRRRKEFSLKLALKEQR